MKRKEFLKLSAIAATFGPLNSIFSSNRSHLNLLSFLENDAKDIAKVSASVQEEFTALIQWLSKNGWVTYLKNVLGVNLSLTGEALKAELIKDLDPERLKKLIAQTGSGYDDFAGMNLIKPGFPAFSLLYHTLASPRVRPPGLTAYPDLEQIDTLENYIYALADWDHLKTIYEVKPNDDLVLAVFAYEYRPAFKTPHHQHADLVYSRTGVARVGQHDMNYDNINRCYTNMPKSGVPVQKAAVVPARYGLFIAKRVKSTDIDLMTTGMYKPGDKFNDEQDSQRTFLQPVRKVFQHDLLFGEGRLTFGEEHRSEKLAKLAEHTDLKFYRDIKPTIRDSAYLIVQDPKITQVNSSFLVVSQPRELIRLAKEGNKALYFLVPTMIPGEEYPENRYFTSFNTQNVEDVELLVPVGPGNYQKIPNKYNEPRTQPLFLNITHELDSLNQNGYREVLKDSAFEKRINDGLYQAPLFEDSICEGRVTARIINTQPDALNGVSGECLPAFSIVTAPDFFPQVDNFDLVAFDVNPGSSRGISNFYEGGIASLATCRLTPNPEWIAPNARSDNHTITAVLSQKTKSSMPSAQNGAFNNPSLPKGYIVSGFLPDVASSVFAPGWDITYSADKPGSMDVYLSTEGLGSPFVEDMKLCAAANGMWPASSPDSARTYQGSLDPWSRNPTAIPLLDDELGFHKNSPACEVVKEKESFGWDGVQGPYLYNRNGKWVVNFADIGRADVVQNALDGNVDMSKLRMLTSGELISRMSCLKKVIENLPKVNFKGYTKEDKMVAFTTWWLVSAEPVNFGQENAKGWGIPKTLVGADTSWVTNKANAKVSGKGYLFVIVDSGKMTTKNVIWDSFGRRVGYTPNIYVAQVVDNPAGTPDLALATVKGGKAKWELYPSIP
ncbi:MAG TPA: hypothetical protein VFG10_14520 [Saprospiraceae bacterium]|nr:hypothetical protein [Saprospiraceae bacterium]